MTSLDRVRELAAARVDLDEQLRAAIIQAHTDNVSIRKIAEAAGVSHGTIHNLIRNQD